MEEEEDDTKLKMIIIGINIHFVLLILGDGAVGKTCLLLTYIKKGYPQEYNPTVVDHYTAKVRIFGQRLDIDLWDTAGQEEFVAIRRLSYPGSHVSLICYNTVARSSIDNILSVWYPEIQESCPGLPCVLVGTKEDLKEEAPHLAVSDKYARTIQKKIKAYDWIECSAIRYEDREASKIDLAFRTAISCVLDSRLGDKGGCCLIL